VHEGFRLGVPRAGTWRDRLNTDSAHYGGSNAGSAFGVYASEDIPWNDRAQSIVLTLPPLATLFVEWTP
jgi:1,4-alpha-glucan branching enzyme